MLIASLDLGQIASRDPIELGFLFPHPWDRGRIS